MKIDTLMAELIRDEGFRSKPYLDSVGKVTIGIGRNLDDVGITEAEARYLLSNDIRNAENDIYRNLPWYDRLPEPAQRALVNMCFNMGWSRLSKFHQMLNALCKEDWERAASEALDSKWSKQVGDRSKRIAELFKSCG